MFESWKGANFWNNIILVSFIIIEFMIFTISDPMIIGSVFAVWIGLIVVIKSRMELSLYKKIGGLDFLLGHTVFDSNYDEDCEFGIEKKILYGSEETLDLFEMPIIEEDPSFKEKLLKLFGKKKGDKEEYEPKKAEFKLKQDQALYECKLFRKYEYEIPINAEEMEIIEYDRLFLLLPSEFSESLDMKKRKWEIDDYPVNISSAKVILQCKGWVNGETPLFKLRFSDKIGLEEMDKFSKVEGDADEAIKLALGKIIKKLRSELKFFEHERTKLNIEIDRLTTEVEGYELKLQNATDRPLMNNLKQRGNVPMGVLYVLIALSVLGLVMLGGLFSG